MITKRGRDQAILIASAMACNDMHGVKDRDIKATLGVSDAAYDLWWEMWVHVANTYLWMGDAGNPEWDAEAECLLREGFTP